MAVLDAQGSTVTFNDGGVAQTVGGVVSFSLAMAKPILIHYACKRSEGIPPGFAGFWQPDA